MKKLNPMIDEMYANYRPEVIYIITVQMDLVEKVG